MERKVISEGKRFREVVELSTTNLGKTSKTVHEEKINGKWGPRKTIKSYNKKA
jgi:hypothetical protein